MAARSGGAALLLAVPAWRRTATLYLHLRTSIEELLPRDAPSVLAVEEFARARLASPISA